MTTADQIRTAYRSIATQGGYVRLADLRPAVNAPRGLVDAELVRMSRQDDVWIIPNSQQGDLTQADRDAAVQIGAQMRHLIRIT